MSSAPFCVQRRAALLAADEKKVYILHDEAENSTMARLRTLQLAKDLDRLGVVSYYK